MFDLVVRVTQIHIISSAYCGAGWHPASRFLTGSANYALSGYQAFRFPNPVRDTAHHFRRRPLIYPALLGVPCTLFPVTLARQSFLAVHVASRPVSK